jgi:hypothetical protein
MARIEFKNNKTKALEELEGDDGRISVSSRSDTRAYYNSRNQRQTYAVPFDHQSAAAGEFSLYIENTSSQLKMVVSRAGLNSVEFSRLRLWFVSGVAAGGTLLTPTNLNKGSSNDADAVVRQAGAGDAITGLTTLGQIDFEFVSATGHGEFTLSDTVRLGQNDAIAIEYDEGTTGDLAGVVDFFFE